MKLAPVVYFSVTRVPEIQEYELFRNIYVVGLPSHISATDTVLGIHGCGVLSDQMIMTRLDAEQALARLPNQCLADVGGEIRGSLTLYIADQHQQRIAVLADPLGGGLVFTHRDSEGCAISSDLEHLVSFLSSIGKKPKKSLSYVASYIATGSGGLVPSSYEDIHVLPQFSFVEVSTQGPLFRDYTCKAEFFRNEMPYEDALEATVDEISRNVLAMSKAPAARRVAHLTGGVDSRIVLGAIMHSGVKDDFSFFCGGGPTAPDQIVAKKLASEYSLMMTENSGLESNWAPESLDQQLLLPFVETSGIVSGVVRQGYTVSSNLVASGGYGELFRSFYNRGSVEASVSISAERMFGRTAFSSDPRRRILSREFVEKLLGSLEEGFHDARLNGVRSDAELDYIYFSRRNRYFVGEISRSVSKYTPRFDPLYSLHGASLGLRVDGVARDGNIIGFDLMNRLDERLALLPFDYDRYAGSYSKIRAFPQLQDFTSTAAVRYDSAKREVLPQKSAVAAHGPSKSDIERANKLRMSPRNIQRGRQIQKGASDILRGIPKKETRSFFSDSLTRLVLTDEPSHRAHYRRARNLYAALLWYQEG